MPYCVQCGSSVEIIPGHRPRRYCNSECKQTAYRRRRGIKPRKVRDPLEDIERYNSMKKFEKNYPDLMFGTYIFLYETEKQHGPQLAHKIAKKLILEVQRAQRQS